MNHKCCLLFIFLCCFFQISAQDFKSSGIGISYYLDNITHSGIQIKYELPLSHKKKVLGPKDSKDLKEKDMLVVLGINARNYYHKGHHTGLILLPECIARTIGPGGFKFDIALGLGYHRSFVDGPVFEVDNAGVIIEKKTAGQNSFLINFDIGMGQDLRRTGKPTAWTTGIGFNARSPYNTKFLPALYLYAGMSRYFSKSNPKPKSI